MNLIKIARKPYLSLFMAVAVLFVSCEQYDQQIQKVENKFDYTFYEQNKNNPVFNEINIEINESISKLQKQTVTERNKGILNIVNSKTGDLLNPNLYLELIELNPQEMLAKSLENKLINKDEFNLTNSFLLDLKKKGVDFAISNYEKKVLNMDLNKEEFSKKNMFINTIMFTNFKNPSLFEENNSSEYLGKSQGFWSCLAATVVLIAATVGLSGCATVVLCGLSLFAFGYSFNNWMNKCVGQHSVL